MQIENIEIYASYLYFSCEDTVDEGGKFIVKSVCDAHSDPALVSAKRELAILMRYWLSRDIWDAFDEDQELARELNLVVLRSFTDSFKLPKDGTGLRYAELPSLQEQMRELSHRLGRVFEVEDGAVLKYLEQRIMDWRKACREAINNLERATDAEIERRVSEWMDARRRPEA